MLMCEREGGNANDVGGTSDILRGRGCVLLERVVVISIVAFLGSQVVSNMEWFDRRELLVVQLRLLVSISVPEGISQSRRRKWIFYFHWHQIASNFISNRKYIPI